jgi:phosphoenolpyruvate carboxykinase (GTP)
VFERVSGRGQAERTAIGNVPAPGAIDIADIDVSPADMELLLQVDPDEWRRELPLIREHYAGLGDHLPAALVDELDRLGGRLEA